MRIAAGQGFLTSWSQGLESCAWSAGIHRFRNKDAALAFLLGHEVNSAASDAARSGLLRENVNHAVVTKTILVKPLGSAGEWEPQAG